MEAQGGAGKRAVAEGASRQGDGQCGAQARRSRPAWLTGWNSNLDIHVRIEGEGF